MYHTKSMFYNICIQLDEDVVYMFCRSNQEETKYAAIEKQRRFMDEYNITDINNSSISSNITIPYVDSHFNIYVFTGIILAVFLFGLARALLFFKIAVDASQKLHNMMFTRILRSPISFFDTNPVGKNCQQSTLLLNIYISQ